MNIFILSLSIKRCARYHCDKHILKMILETCQMLYTCLWCVSPELVATAPLNKSGNHGYKKSHENHPCAVWVREAAENYVWLCELGLALCDEYEHRYNKTHACREHLEWLSEQTPDLSPGRTPFRQVVGDGCEDDDVVVAYRNYYCKCKRDMATWTNRERPYWFD